MLELEASRVRCIYTATYFVTGDTDWLDSRGIEDGRRTAVPVYMSRTYIL